MSLVTAVPFGLGVRETIHKKQALADAQRAEDNEARRLRDDYEAEVRREKLARERKLAERMTKLEQLYGPKPAQLGSLLEGIELGGFQPEHVRSRVENAVREGLFELTLDEHNNSVYITIGSDYEATDAACTMLRDKLRAAWGPPSNGVWLDPEAKRRARFDSARCRLEFERYHEPAEWVAALPFDLVGARKNVALERVPNAELDDGILYWHIPGVRYGKGATDVEAYFDKDRVVGIKATVATDFDSMVAVREAVSARLGVKAMRDEVTGVWSWKNKNVVLDPVRRDGSDTERFYIVIGKIPWD